MRLYFQRFFAFFLFFSRTVDFGNPKYFTATQRIARALFLLSNRRRLESSKTLRLLREEEEERNDELFQCVKQNVAPNLRRRRRAVESERMRLLVLESLEAVPIRLAVFVRKSFSDAPRERGRGECVRGGDESVRNGDEKDR